MNIQSGTNTKNVVSIFDTFKLAMHASAMSQTLPYYGRPTAGSLAKLQRLAQTL